MWGEAASSVNPPGFAAPDEAIHFYKLLMWALYGLLFALVRGCLSVCMCVCECVCVCAIVASWQRIYAKFAFLKVLSTGEGYA